MVLTVKEYLTGAVGNVPVSDSTMKMCLFRADALTYEEDGEAKDTQFDTDISLVGILPFEGGIVKCRRRIGIISVERCVVGGAG